MVQWLLFILESFRNKSELLGNCQTILIFGSSQIFRFNFPWKIPIVKFQIFDRNFLSEFWCIPEGSRGVSKVSCWYISAELRKNPNQNSGASWIPTGGRKSLALYMMRIFSANAPPRGVSKVSQYMDLGFSPPPDTQGMPKVSSFINAGISSFALGIRKIILQIGFKSKRTAVFPQSHFVILERSCSRRIQPLALWLLSRL